MLNFVKKCGIIFIYRAPRKFFVLEFSFWEGFAKFALIFA